MLLSTIVDKFRNTRCFIGLNIILYMFAYTIIILYNAVMRVAFDKEQNKINISDAIHKGPYTCTLCGQALIVKKGADVKWHFAHKNGPCKGILDKNTGIGTVPALWNYYKPVVMIVENTKTKRKFKIHSNPAISLSKYNKCYGYMSDDNGSFPKETKPLEIYAWDKPIWSILWYKTKEDSRKYDIEKLR